VNTLSVLFVCYYEKMLDLFFYLLDFLGVIYFGFGTILVKCAHCTAVNQIHACSYIYVTKRYKSSYIDTVCAVCISHLIRSIN